MTKADAKNKIELLRETMKYHAEKYYNQDNPEITDPEYDALGVELRALEKEFPEFLDLDSPTQKIYGTIKSGFEKVVHEVPLLSLEDVFSKEEVKEFCDKYETNYVVETKIDGLSVSLEYENGIFKRGATRGNGRN